MTDLNTLARQLVEHPRWTWQPGMGIRTLGDSTDIVAWVTATEVNAATPCGSWIRYRQERLRRPDGCTVDLENAATKGWLLHMLREAHGGGYLDVRYHRYSNRPPERTWDIEVDEETFTGPTEGAALAAALLAVWNGGAHG